MSGWGGFWIGLAWLGLGIVMAFGLVNWAVRVDCGWLHVQKACEQVAEYYEKPPADDPVE